MHFGKMNSKGTRLMNRIAAVMVSAAMVVTGVPQTGNTVYATEDIISQEMVENPESETQNDEAHMEDMTDSDNETGTLDMETGTEVESETENVANTETEVDTSVETETNTSMETETESQVDAEVETEINTSIETEAQTEAETEIESNMSNVGDIQVIELPEVDADVSFLPKNTNKPDGFEGGLGISYEVTELPVQTAEGVYRIDNQKQFISFLASDDYKNATINLNCDIDMKGGILTYNSVFSGTFNGNGHSINNALVEQGMFYRVETNGEVKKLHISNVATTGDSSCGVVANVNNGTISECVVTGNLVSGERRNQTAGIVAVNKGTVKDCVFSGMITATSETDGYGKYIGGIAGENSGMIENCHALGTITTSAAIVAGIVSDNTGTVKKCSNYMEVSGAFDVGGVTAYNNRGIIDTCHNYGAVNQKVSSEGQAAGISAINTGDIVKSFNHAMITGAGRNISGIAATNAGKLDNCGNYAEVTGFASVGAIAGLCNGESVIKGCFNKGIVKGIGNIDTAIGVGGVVGSTSDKAMVKVVDCYNTGIVYSGDNTRYIGGIAGILSKGSIVNCYNAGGISAPENNYVAMIAGFMGEPDTAIYDNCMFLDTDKDAIENICYRESGAVSDENAKMSQEELKAAAGLLGSGFAIDDSNLNEGYPVVAGQVGEKTEYPVVYELNGGCLDNYFVIAGKNESVTIPQQPQKQNAYFMGWYEDKGFSVAFDFSKGITGATVLYAKWDNYTAVEDYSLVSDKVTLVVGENYQIKVNFVPADAKNTGLTWESDNTAVATVSENGTINALAAGTAVITVKLKDGSLPKELKFTVNVTSDSNVIRIKDCDTNTEISSLSVAVNDPKLIQVVFGKTPSDSARLEWQSSRPECVRVTKNTDSIYGSQAKIEALKPGKSIITVILTEGKDTYAALLEVTVQPLATNVYIKLDNENLNDKTAVYDLVTRKFISVGENKIENPTDILSVYISPSNASQKVTWKSDSKSVLKFEDEKSGRVTGNKEGTAKVTATATDGSGVKATATIKTKRIAQALKLVPKEISKETPVVRDENGYIILTTGNSIRLLTEFTPVDVTNEMVRWSISDKNAIQIDPQTNTVTAREVAHNTIVTVTATALDEGEAACEVKFIIKPLVEEIQIYKTTDMENSVNDSVIGIHPDRVEEMRFSLVVKNKPDNSSQVVTWKSSNTKVATVYDNKDGSCNITVKGKGQSVITATASDGSGVTAAVTINVSSLVEQINVIGGDMVMKGKTITLKTEVSPKSATNKNVVWESIRPDYAAVEKNTGKVTGLRAGIAIIKATAADGGGATTLHTIKVTDKIKSLDIVQFDGNNNTDDDVVMSGKNIGIDPDATDAVCRLSARVLPETACQTVEWESSNEKIATVSENGVVTAVGIGKATITVKATDGSGMSAKVTVYVNTLVKSVKIIGSHYVGAQKSIQLQAEVGDKDAANKKLVWSSQYPDIATVDQKGKVTAVADTGNVIITAEAADGSGVKAEHKIFVRRKSNTVRITSFDNDCTIETNESGKKTLDWDMSKNDSIRLEAKISGGSDADAYYPAEILWSSSNKKIATVTAENVGNKQVARVDFLAEGTVTLTAKMTDGTEVKDSCIISVENSNPKVQITGPSQVAKGKKIKLSTGNTKVEWSSSDKTIAVVNSNGQVTGKALGTVQIMAKAVDGTNEDIITINVEPATKVVKLYHNGLDVTKNEIGFDLVKKYSEDELKLEAQLDGVMTDAVTWKSSKTSVLTINEEGRLEILKSGKATVTATAADGSGKKATVNITIAKQVTSITADENITDINLAYKKSLQLNVNYKPLAATTKKAVWTSSHPDVVSVSKTGGKISAKKSSDNRAYPEEGYVTITARAADNGNAVCQFRVYVTTPVNTVQIVREGHSYISTIGMDIDAIPPVLKLTTNLLDKNKNDLGEQRVIWESSDEKIATVDADGVVEGISTGKVTITATTTDGTKRSGKVTIYVGKLVTSIVYDGDASESVSVTLKKKKSIKLADKLTVYPITATNQTLKYSTSDKKIATVDSKGKITAKKEGTAYITVSTTDGSGIEKVIEVTVTR